MSDYDNVRSCCTGKQICTHCWTWMSCAAHVLRSVLEEDFGFQYILPVYSGRRGVHLWVCDRRARGLHDDERSALVGYLTVVAPKTLRSATVSDLGAHRAIHPTIRHLLREHMEPAFAKLFLHSGTDNPNNVATNPKAAAIVYEAITAVLKAARSESLSRFTTRMAYSPGNVLDWSTVLQALGSSERDVRDIVQAVSLLLMYPRLDEHVSTRRDHLLKLPFCIHPGTGSLCCPLEWAEIDAFDPLHDAPDLKSILLERQIDPKWERPLVRMLERMSADEEERARS
ncbi:DNA primase small subunit [Strigomonas culicis]|nr:DNA primase small subunit [Strigomonas culicis]|eukprot:EPY19568.1 DNA primase small subunit [Strigomonas culicis]